MCTTDRQDVRPRPPATLPAGSGPPPWVMRVGPDGPLPGPAPLPCEPPVSCEPDVLVPVAGSCDPLSAAGIDGVPAATAGIAPARHALATPTTPVPAASAAQSRGLAAAVRLAAARSEVHQRPSAPWRI